MFAEGREMWAEVMTKLLHPITVVHGNRQGREQSLPTLVSEPTTLRTFNRRVVGLTPTLAATQGPWESPLPTVACALRRETPMQYPCCSRERL